MPQPMIAIRTPAASGPTQRGPPVSYIVVLGTRSPNASMSSSMISMISDRRVALQAGGPHAASIAHPGPIGTPLRGLRSLALSPPGC